MQAWGLADDATDEAEAGRQVGSETATALIRSVRFLTTSLELGQSRMNLLKA